MGVLLGDGGQRGGRLLYTVPLLCLKFPCCLSSDCIIQIFMTYFLIIKGVKLFGFSVSAGTFVCESWFFRASIQTNSPASREELMNNYFHIFQTLKHFCCAQTLGAGLIMLFACLRTTFFLFFLFFCPAVSAAARFLASRGSAAVRMRLLLHPPELKQTSPILRQSSLPLKKNLSKRCSKK